MIHPVTVTDELLAELITEVKGLRADLQAAPAPAQASAKARPGKGKQVPLDGR